jgi:hypothetical protein
MSFDQEILDSGARAHFETGAVRDVNEGKGRCDLLPCDALAHLLVCRNFDQPGPNIGVLGYLLGYLYRPDKIEYLIHAAQSLFQEVEGEITGNLPDTPYLEDFPNAILALSQHFEKGAVKYEARNWEKGIPTGRYIDSAIRHYLRFLADEQDEPHLIAALWNVVCLHQTLIWIDWGQLSASLQTLPFRTLRLPPSKGDEEALQAYETKAREVYGENLNQPFVDEATLADPGRPVVGASLRGGLVMKWGTAADARTTSINSIPNTITTDGPPVIVPSQEEVIPQFPVEDGLYVINTCYALVVNNRVYACCKCDGGFPVHLDKVRKAISLNLPTYYPVTVTRYIPILDDPSVLTIIVECIRVKDIPGPKLSDSVPRFFCIANHPDGSLAPTGNAEEAYKFSDDWRALS